MVDVTQNFRLNKPFYDQPGWDVYVNNNWISIDSLLQRVTTIIGYMGIWTNAAVYLLNQVVTDSADSSLWQCAIGNTAAATGTFAADRALRPTLWTNVTVATTSAVSAAAAASASQTAAAASATAAAASATAAAASAVSAASSATSALTSVLSYSSTIRNKLRNAAFTVQQRGVGPFSTAVYTADGWLIQKTNGVIAMTLTVPGFVIRSAVGDEEMEWYALITFTGSAAAADFIMLTQRIEDVQRLSNKTITVSFWAQSTTPITVGLEMVQNFGTGGGPSADVQSIGAQPIVTTNAWTRYSATITMPSISAKTLGTTATTSYTALNLWFSSGATNNTRASNIGVVTGAINLWGVQVEVGSSATVLEKRDPQVELAMCQRYYQTGVIVNLFTAAAGGNQAFASVGLPVSMRVSPTLAGAGNASANFSGAAVSASGTNVAQVAGTATAGGTVTISQNFTASAEL